MHNFKKGRKCCSDIFNLNRNTLITVNDKHVKHYKGKYCNVRLKIGNGGEHDLSHNQIMHSHTAMD